MKLDIKFSSLQAQRERIGAALSSWKINSADLANRQNLLDSLEEGIEIDLDQVEVGPGGLLAYLGEQVILYIKDTQSSLATLKDEPEQSKRFHVAECRTLRKMRAAGRFERYVVTRRADGKFLVHYSKPGRWWSYAGETEASLKVCKDCLNAINYQMYFYKHESERNLIWWDFSIADFLMEYSTFFTSQPSRRDTTAIPDEYVKDWSRIGQQQKEEARWHCEECGVNLSEFSVSGGLMHCHHKNGVKTDNRPENLSVLCVLCHAKQPYHQHMKVPPHQRDEINRIRIQQGIQPTLTR